MVILRGVSGSGKSTLCERIVRELSDAGIRVDVASADHFFNQPDGTYKFDRELLGQAHEACQKECWRLCADENSRVVIVDNTNILFWEFRPYLHFAHRCHFVTLLVEPRTAWRYDWRELAARNVHGVEPEVIAGKVEKLRDNFIFPIYYGFMISAGDSGMLRSHAAKLARSMLQVDEMREVVDGEQGVLVNEFVRRTDEELMQWGEREDLFHCTAFYTKRGERPGVREYENSDLVQRNLGKLHRLELLGLLVSPWTISYHVQLNGEQLSLWNQEEHLTHPGLPRGSRAHLTVTTARGIEAVQSGFDTLKLAELSALGKPHVTTSIAAGTVMKYDEGLWYLLLEKPMMVDTLFAAFYGR